MARFPSCRTPSLPISLCSASRPVGRQLDSIATDIAQPGRIATLCSASRPYGRQPGGTATDIQ
ncbi:MAG: hypothetical protein PUD39_04110 [Bacteroidales bacterium]|nr:hypothetical protein [Bacteroidales bacterium]